jgi:plastocyanin
MMIIKRSAVAAAALAVAFGSSVGVGHATTYSEDFATFNPLLSISVGDTVDFSSSCTDCGDGGDFFSLSETAPKIMSIAANMFVAEGDSFSYTFTIVGTYAYGSAPLAVIDNISVSLTPIPAAFPLFATGLAAMGFFGLRKKHKVSGADCLAAA